MCKAIGVFILFCSSMAIDSLAQGSLIRFGVGYGIPIATPIYGSTVDRTNNTVNSITAVYGSGGGGININAGYSLRFNQYLGVDFDVIGLFGKTQEYNYNINGTTIYSQKTSQYLSAWYFNPSLVLTVPVKKFEVFAKMGPTGGLMTVIARDDVDQKVGNGPADIYRSKTETTGGLSIGLKSAIGILVPLTSRFSLSGEFNCTVISFVPNKQVYKESATNGSDNLAGATISQKEFVYVDKLTQGTQSPTSPTQRLQTSTNASSIGIQVGVVYKLRAPVVKAVN